MGKLINLEKGTQRYFGITLLLLSVMLVLSSLGKVSWTQWITAIFSVILGLVLYSEGGIRTYLASKGYRKIDGNDVIVWLSFVFGTALILNGVLTINAIKNVAPEWIINFTSVSGIVGGAISGILAVFLILTPRPKA